MGRWAQAQRRGGFAAPSSPPVIDCANVVFQAGADSDPTVWRITAVGGGIPTGVTGIAWEAGAADCTETDGQAVFAALPVTVISIPGENQDAFARFAWVVGDEIQPFGCGCTEYAV